MVRGRAALAAPLFCALAAFPALAQTPPPPRPLGPGDPLPPFQLDYRRGTLVYEPDPNGARWILTNSALTMGDVRFQADHIVVYQKTYRVEATGNVVLTRGDETVRAESFVFEGEDTSFVATNAVVVSPPFYVSGARITRTAVGLIAQNALLSPCAENKGEIRFVAQQIEIVDNRYAVLRRPTLYLFGTRLVTLPRYRIVLPRGRGSERDEYRFSVPLRVRQSRISGVVLGIGSRFYLGEQIGGSFAADLPSKRPLQYAVSLGRDFLPDQPVDRPRGLFADPTRRDAVLAPGASPLREFLRARPLAPLPDPILDFEDISSTQSPLSRPTRTTTRALVGEINLTGNREVGDKRQGDLLLSRLPEVRLAGRLPLGTQPPPADNEAARRYVRAPRVLLSGEASAGRYAERALEQSRMRVSRTRTLASVGLETLPLLLGERLLVLPRAAVTLQRYSGGQAYRHLEASLAADYVLGTRTAVGAAYIRRFTGGQTPFTFDQIDTKNEAQARAQLGLGKLTLALLGRYDVDQGRVFDFEITVGLRGRCLEPRLSYRKLSQQIGFTLAFPGLGL